jgi:hypothetical protein
MAADYSEHHRIIFQSGSKAFGYCKSDGETFVAGAGPELCVAMGKEIERLRTKEAEARQLLLEARDYFCDQTYDVAADKLYRKVDEFVDRE